MATLNARSSSSLADHALRTVNVSGKKRGECRRRRQRPLVRPTQIPQPLRRFHAPAETTLPLAHPKTAMSAPQRVAVTSIVAIQLLQANRMQKLSEMPGAECVSQCRVLWRRTGPSEIHLSRIHSQKSVPRYVDVDTHVVRRTKRSSTASRYRTRHTSERSTRAVDAEIRGVQTCRALGAR